MMEPPVADGDVLRDVRRAAIEMTRCQGTRLLGMTVHADAHACQAC
jgi:hypothetical protein